MNDIAIQCGEKAYELVRESYERDNFYPSATYTAKDGSHILAWYGEEWDEDSDEVIGITSALFEARELRTESGDTEYDFRYLKSGYNLRETDEITTDVSRFKDLRFDIHLPETMEVDDEVLSDDDESDRLKKTIIADCHAWSHRNRDRAKSLENTLTLCACKNSEENGLYRLILNGKELWYGTLWEINAIVKSMLYRQTGGYGE